MSLARLIVVPLAVVVALTTEVLAGPSWNMGADWSMSSNPNGAWSYGRKWDMEGGSFESMSLHWSYGWMSTYWYPSMQAGADGINLWANDNARGYPVVRWTCADPGFYRLTTRFTGYDSRGNDNLVYVTINGSVHFSDHIVPSFDTADYLIDSIYLNQGDHIDFSAAWNGGVPAAYGWTVVAATIAPVPEPGTLSLLAIGGLALIRRRRTAQ